MDGHTWNVWSWPPAHGWGYDAKCDCGFEASGSLEAIAESMGEHRAEQQAEAEQAEAEAAHT